jgi:hypothetical protein
MGVLMFLKRRAPMPNRNGPMRWLFVLLAVLGSANLVWGQCETCKWLKRGKDQSERYEGIKSRPVSGGCCEILGVHYERKDRINASASQLHLFFWLPESVSPRILVWQPSTNYMMEPVNKKYPKGLQSFSWPRQEVIAPLGVNVDTLYTTVRDSREVYFPALLSTSERPKPAGSYAFVLESGGGISGQGTIERESAGKLTPVRSFPIEEEFGGRVQINWDGLDGQGKPVAAGTYVLRLKGTLEGETIEPLNYILHFQHYGNFE